MEKTKCLICDKKLNNEEHFLCYEHYKELGGDSNEEYDETLKSFLYSYKQLKCNSNINNYDNLLNNFVRNYLFLQEFESFKKYQFEILMYLDPKILINFAVVLSEYINAFENYNTKIPKHRLYKIPNKPLIVRSNGEYKIAKVLDKNNIKYTYDKIIKGQKKPHSKFYYLRTDFYLEEKNIYIEFWGMDDKDYQLRRKAKEELYKKENHKLISIENKINDKKMQYIKEYELEEYLLSEINKRS